MLDAGALIEKHQIEGCPRRCQPAGSVPDWSRQQAANSQFQAHARFTIRDFDLLARLIGWFGRLYATPHVLSQVSDLTDLSGKELRKIRSLFKLLVEKIEESYETSRVLVSDPIFERLGLADAAIARVCAREFSCSPRISICKLRYSAKGPMR